MKTTLLAAASFALTMTAAEAAVLTFDPVTACMPAGHCNGIQEISQTYGDMPGVDVIYERNLYAGLGQSALYWGPGYESLSSVAYGAPNGQLSIMFMASAGYEVFLSGFDIAPFSDRLRNTSYQIYDLATSFLLASESYSPLSIDGVTSITGNWSSAVGLQIVLGPDSWDVGISNIVYDAQPIAPVPLPASALLLLGGVGGLALLRRRRG